MTGRRGRPILGNTVGNLAAEGVASIGRENINADLVRFSDEERAAMQVRPVGTTDVPASTSVDQTLDMIINASSNFGGQLFSGGGTNFSLFKKDTSLVPVFSRNPEWFTASALSATKALGLDQVINGELFTAPFGYQAYAGTVGVDPNSIGIQGQIVQNGRVIAGNSSPETYYIAQYRDQGTGGITNIIGKGNPPLGASVGFGGGIPLIVDGLKFGDSNLYSSGIVGPLRGDPGKFAGYLTQRNNDGLHAFITGDLSKDSRIGKTIVAFNSKNGVMTTVVQQHGSQGFSILGLQNRLINAGFNNAIVFDGSSSSTLTWGNKVISTPGDYKNASIPVGIGFKSRY